MKNQLTKRWSIHLLLAVMLAMASVVSLSSSQQVMAATTAQSESAPADDANGIEDDDADGNDDDADGDDEDGDDEDGNDEDGDDDGGDDEDGDDDDGDDEDGDDENENEVYGTVDAMPSSTLIGTWIVDGISYEAVSSTEFEEEQGAFGVGVTVELEFTVVNGLNQLDEVETHRAPGTGSTTESGVIRSMGAAIQAASIQGRAAWQVGETTYTVLPVTKLDEVNGLLAVGTTAEVNSYTAADGSAVATLVRSMGSNQMTYSLFLPTLVQ